MEKAQDMSIHILFDNGSNPFVRYNMTPAEFAKEVLKWDKTFILQLSARQVKQSFILKPMKE